jgi:hypothetical protein
MPTVFIDDELRMSNVEALVFIGRQRVDRLLLKTMLRWLLLGAWTDIALGTTQSTV